MNLTSKQRAYLGSLANTIDPIFQIGKSSLTPEIISAIDDAIEKRELIKVAVLKNCIDDPKEIAAVIGERTHSTVVKVIGKKIILYREARKNPKIKLPQQNRFVKSIAIMRIGILGGSFDPIHNGHLNMAISAYEEFKLDKVLLMPAAHSPNKDENKMTSFEDRFEMCKLAAKGYYFLEVSDFENTFEERSYTYITMTKLKELYPDDDLYFIMGGDSLDYFEKWVHPEIIASKCTILVIIRENFEKKSMEYKISSIKKLFPCRIELVNCEKFNVSSSEIRKIIKEETVSSNKLDTLLSKDVRKYISNKKLY